MELAEKKNEEYFLSAIIVGGPLILYLISFYSYLLFHSLVEIFTIIVALGIFVIAWSSKDHAKNDFLLIIGIAYLFIGALDLLHALTYTGMNVIPGASSDTPTQLWIAARYLSSISFLVAFLYLGKKEEGKIYENKNSIAVLFIAYSITCAVIILSIFYWKVFPATFVEGVGLTSFKKNSEYIISLLFFISLLLLFLKRRFLHEKMANMLFFSIATKIASELSFTGYASVFGFSNMLGHIFKFMSFLFLYRAFIDFGLKRPYEFLFLDLKKSEESLKHKASFPMLNPSPVIEIDSSGKVIFLNPAAEEALQNLEMNGKKDVFFPKEGRGLLERLKKGETALKYLEIKARDRFFGLTLFTIPDMKVIRVYAFDITGRKRAEEELKKSQQQLLKKTEEQLAESYRHMGIVNRRISIILEMEEYFKKESNTTEASNYILQLAINLSGASVGIIYEYDGERFGSVCHCKLDLQRADALHTISRKEIKFLKKLVKDCKRISGFCELIDIGSLNIGGELNYFVILPLMDENLIRGFIFLGFEGDKSLGSQDLEFLEVFASHAGKAFSKSRKRSVPNEKFPGGYRKL